MKITALTFIMLFSMSLVAQNTVTMDVLRPLFGKEWAGTLTYLDYGSKEQTSIQVAMTVEPVNDYEIEVTFAYPGEESANSTSRITFSEDGKTFNGQNVVAVESLGNGVTEILTSEYGEDDGKHALLTYTYVIGQNIYSNEKFVLYEGEDRAILRNSYSMRSADQ